MATEDRDSADLLDEGAEGEAPEEEEEEEERDPVARLDKIGAPVLKGAHRSRFFTVISLLERLTPDAKRIGEDGPADQERIRFVHDPDLIFAASDIREARVKKLPKRAERSLDEDIAVFEVKGTFLGLTGSVSPMPLYMVEEIQQEDPFNPVRRDFLDIFHHRIYSLLYRAGMKYMPAREHVTKKDDVWMLRALALGGLDVDIQTYSRRIPRHTLVRLVPLLSGRGRNPRVLEAAMREVLGDVLGLAPDVRVREFVGGWIKVDPAQRMSLGMKNCELGSTAIIGQHAFDRSGRFAMEIGPLNLERYRRFLDPEDIIPIVKEVVALVVREPLDFDLELLLDADAVPSFVLSTVTPTVLGRDTRLTSDKDNRAPEVVIMRDIMAADDEASEKADEVEAAE